MPAAERKRVEMGKKEKAADKNSVSACHIKTSIGGQALIEGIMMRGPKVTAMAVRNPQGEIVLEQWETVGTKRARFFRLPFIRGIFNFVDSMRFGYKCLMRSAEISGFEETETPEGEKAEATDVSVDEATRGVDPAIKENGGRQEENAGCPVGEKDQTDSGDAEPTKISSDCTGSEKKDQKAEPAAGERKKTSPAMGIMMVISTVLAFVIAIGLFIWLPAKLYEWLPDSVFSPDNRYLKSVFEGVCKIVFLVGYMALVSLMKDIRRTFMFHGAEHKTIFCYEAGLPLTVENIRKMRRFHPRCGTSFLILMVLVSILIGFFLPPSWATPLRVALKLLLIPVVVGIGYELIKFAGRHDNLLTKIISAPGLWLQRITVLEPDDDMIECAIRAITPVIPDDGSDRW